MGFPPRSAGASLKGRAHPPQVQPVAGFSPAFSGGLIEGAAALRAPGRVAAGFSPAFSGGLIEGARRRPADAGCRPGFPPRSAGASLKALSAKPDAEMRDLVFPRVQRGPH